MAETVTRYYYDDQRVVLETDYDSSGPSESDLRYFIYGNYIDEVLVMHDCSSGNDYYYGHDHLFSPVVLFDDDGAAAERYEYDAYGACRVLDADLTADADGLSDFGNPYLFTGRRLDSLDNGDLPIMYYRARYYDPAAGRFMQRDPAEYIDSMNMYEYVTGNPLINRDPIGYSASCGNIIIDIGIDISKWAACKAIERSIAAYTTGPLDAAWRNFTGMSPRKDPISLNDGDMDGVFGDYDIISKMITPLVSECKNSTHGWSRIIKKGLDGGRYKYSYGSYYRSGSWGSALGGVSFTAYVTCYPCNKLAYTVTFNDPFDFDNMRKGLKQLPRNVIVALIKYPNLIFECGWSNFNHTGEKSGEIVFRK